MDIFDGLTALGGLCLFLFGMQIMAEALQRRAGGRLEGLLRRMTRSRWAGFFTGLAVTAAVQSSSAAMVMVVGFVNSGMLTLRQAVGVIMGTNVGTTVTPWLLSLGGLEGGGVLGRLLRPAGFVPLLSLWGIAAYLAGKGSRRDTGQALLGFAVLMQGMEIMTAAVSGLARAEGFRKLFTAFGSPLLGVLAGAVLTAVIQSSSASVGILQALAASGQVTVGAAIPIVMGQNIGTCVTAMLSSVGASRSARRAALVHLLFNLAGAGIWLGVFWLVKTLAAPAILDRAVTLPGVAVIHTAFNLLCTAALFPAAGLLERAVLRLLPGEETPSAEPDPRLLAAPAAALERCRELTLEMADLARDNLRRGIQALTEVHPDSARELRRQEERIDGLEDALGTFLVRLGGRTLTRRDSARAAELLMLMGDLERAGGSRHEPAGKRGGAAGPENRAAAGGPAAASGADGGGGGDRGPGVGGLPPGGRRRPGAGGGPGAGHRWPAAAAAGQAHPGNATGGGGHGAELRVVGRADGPGAGGGPLLQHHGVRGGPVRREPESPCRPAGGPAAGPGLRQPGPDL